MDLDRQDSCFNAPFIDTVSIPPIKHRVDLSLYRVQGAGGAAHMRRGEFKVERYEKHDSQVNPLFPRLFQYLSLFVAVQGL